MTNTIYFRQVNRIERKFLGYVHAYISSFIFLICLLCFSSSEVYAQGGGSVVLIYADKSAGYGVAYGTADKIVTCLHIVAGKTAIKVKWGGKEVDALVEKIYKPADLALLKLKSPLGVPPMAAYAGEPPWDENVNYFELPTGKTTVEKKVTVLEERTSLDKISVRITGNSEGLSKLLCSDGTGFYPGMATSVINFKEPNIRKSHSGTPITYGDKILGLVDGGTIVDGKPCLWAIQASDMAKLISLGTPVPAGMKPCEAPGVVNKYMYSGTRSDNPLLTPEEVAQALAFEDSLSSSVSFTDPCENLLTVRAEQRVSFTLVFESLFDESAQNVLDLFSEESIVDGDQQLSIDNLAFQTMDFYQEDLTGVSLAIPSEARFSTSQNSFGNFITLSSPLGSTSISVFISHLDTPEDAEKEMARFKTMCKAMGQQVEATKNNIKDFRCESDNPYYKETVENSKLDQNGTLRSEFMATMVINKTDFVGTIVNVADWNAMWNNPEERLFFYLLEISALLADFTIY